MTLADAVMGRLRRDPDRSSSGDAVEDDATIGLSTDDVFHILQTKRRRDVLRYLQDESGPVRMRDLAEQVAAWEQHTTIEALSSDERQRVYISLYQSHLPKLDEEGIVDYDKDRGVVERTPLAAQFDPYIDEVIGGSTASEERDPWPIRYGLALAFGVVVLASVEFGPLPVSGTGGGLLALVGVAAVTVAHAVSPRGDC